MATPTSSPESAFVSPELDRAIAAARASAVVIWRGERLPLEDVRERIGRLDNRDARDRLYGGYVEALEGINPLYEERLEAWVAAGDVTAIAAERGSDPRELAVDLERFSLHAETPYYAALRRYLALIDIEQGDATEADLWHVARGSAWARWFGSREVRRAVVATGRALIETGDIDGWRAAEHQLGGEPRGSDATVARATSAVYVTLAGSPEWLADELGVSPDEVTPFVDFAAFVRLWRFRRTLAELQYELRLYGSADPALRRAYYSGIVGHMTGVGVADAGYLHVVDSPFASVRKLEAAILGATLVEVLEQRHGLHWWRDPGSAAVVEQMAGATSTDDALAQLGYDALDWRPVLRQIRTRLIGEMSGYGGPNITTRAGTRKV